MINYVVSHSFVMALVNAYAYEKYCHLNLSRVYKIIFHVSKYEIINDQIYFRLFVIENFVHSSLETVQY